MGDKVSEICSAFYYKDRNGICKMFIAFESFTYVNDTQIQYDSHQFACNDGRLISKMLVNDLVVDCGPELEDELLLKSILGKDNMYSCIETHLLPCREGHSRCFSMSEICLFKMDEFKVLIPCRTGEHLHNCANFECNMKFKCPHYYSIPWSYVCDGMLACPNGTDESIGHNCSSTRKCYNIFKCERSQVCIHLGYVCDGHFDCPLGDDEYFCSLKLISCPSGCKCLTFVL